MCGEQFHFHDLLKYLRTVLHEPFQLARDFDGPICNHQFFDALYSDFTGRLYFK